LVKWNVCRRILGGLSFLLNLLVSLDNLGINDGNALRATTIDGLRVEGVLQKIAMVISQTLSNSVRIIEEEIQEDS